MRVLGAALLAITLGLVGTTTPVSAEPSASIDPRRLPTGGRPDIPWLDVSSDRLVQPNGGRTISTRRFPSDVLFHGRDGYLLRDEGSTSSRIVFVSATGRARVVVASTKAAIAAVSTDGSRVVLDRPEYAVGRQTLRVVRADDGRTVGAHTFPAYTRVLAVGPTRVLVSWFARGGGRTGWWNPATDRISVLARREGSAASLTAHRVALRDGTRQIVVDLRTRRVLWHTPTPRSGLGETAVSFSPDDRRVVMLSVGQDIEHDTWDLRHRLRVRDARTGRLLSSFTGEFAAAPGIAPAWESTTTLLLRATGPQEIVGEEPSYRGRAVIRCSTVTARCVRVPISTLDVLLVRKSN